MELNDSHVRQVLEKNYGGIASGETTLFYSGLSNLWLVDSSPRKMLLKEMPNRFPIEGVRKEPVICAHLMENGIPTSQFLRTRNGDFVFQDGKRSYHLQYFIDGTVYELNECPDLLVDEMGKSLALIHRHLGALPNVGFDDHLGPQWILGYDKKKKVDEFSRILSRLSEKQELQNRDEILADVEYRIDALERLDLEEYTETDVGRLTCHPTHGDYHCRQVISQNQQIAGIIDFTTACNLPVTWEIARAFTQSDSSASNGEIDYGRFRSYIGNYLSVELLSVVDLKYLFACYFLQLLGSTFGYRQIAAGESIENSFMDMTSFASWRTKMCRWLEPNRQDLTRCLIEDFG